MFKLLDKLIETMPKIIQAAGESLLSVFVFISIVLVILPLIFTKLRVWGSTIAFSLISISFLVILIFILPIDRGKYTPNGNHEEICGDSIDYEKRNLSCFENQYKEYITSSRGA